MMMQIVMASSVKGSVITVLRTFLKHTHWGLQSHMRYLDARFSPHGRQGSWDFSCSGEGEWKSSWELSLNQCTGCSLPQCTPSPLLPKVSCDTMWSVKKGTDCGARKVFRMQLPCHIVKYLYTSLYIYAMNPWERQTQAHAMFPQGRSRWQL